MEGGEEYMNRKQQEAEIAEKVSAWNQAEGIHLTNREHDK
jgi:hypothetical protein